MFLSKAHCCLARQLHASEIKFDVVNWRRPYFGQFGALDTKIEIFKL